MHINIKESKQKSMQVRIALKDNQFTFCFMLINIKESEQKSKHVTYSESLFSYQENEVQSKLKTRRKCPRK